MLSKQPAKPRNTNLAQNSIAGSRKNFGGTISERDASSDELFEHPYAQAAKRGRNDETPISFQQRSQSCAGGGGVDSAPEQGTGRGQHQQKRRKNRKSSQQEVGEVSLGEESSPSQKARKGGQSKRRVGHNAPDETQVGGPKPLQTRLKKECMDELGLVDPFKAVQFLNDLQRADRPEAYEPEIVT